MRKFTVFVISLALIAPIFAGAQTRNEVRDVRTGVQENVRAQAQNAAQLSREEINTLKDRREEAARQIEATREAAKRHFEVRREEAKQTMETKREELKQRLEAVRDERKRDIVERVYDKVNELNGRLTSHYLDVLGKVAKVLANVESRTDKAEASGLNVASVRSAIAGADSAIATSRVAIDTQAGKSYDVTVTSEETLRADVTRVRDVLHLDLNAARATVRAAHEAVRVAAVALAQVPRVDDINGSDDDGDAASSTE